MTTQVISRAAEHHNKRDLESLFAPRSIAVVGASRNEKSVGYGITRNLIFGGFTGVVYPVNPKANSILSVRCSARVGDIDDEVDLAVVIVPAPAVEPVVLECAEHGIRNFVIISGGFKELGGEGREREEHLQQLICERGLSVIGPNCLGIINAHPLVRMNATFGGNIPRAGSFGLISQSGALCVALLDYANARGIGFSRFASFGNKIDVSEIDLLRNFGADPNTKVILMYLEELSSGPAFLETAYEITHGSNPTPILAIKTGRTPQGAAAAASHTGSLAGSDEVYEAIMRQAGVIRVESVEDMFDYAEMFADPVMPKGQRAAIVTNAGGPGIMATDACVRYGLQLASFRDYTVKSLTYQLPPTCSLKNPVDVIGDAQGDRYRAALDAVSADDGVDQLLVIVTPQMLTDVEGIAQVIADTREICNKPTAACLMGQASVARGIDLLRQRGVPTFMFPEDAMRAMAAKTRFAQWSRSPVSAYRSFEVDDGAIEALLEGELQAGRKQLVELRALEVLQHAGFPVVPFRLARDAAEAAEAARQIGFPVVLKIASPQVLHKTDIGGVRLNLADEAAVRSACDEILAAARQRLAPDSEVWGVLVQKMLPPGKEVILGATRDPRLGTLLMFGLGGIYTEALRDVSFRMAPIRENSAVQMIRSIRAVRLLEGVRGEAPSDTDAIIDCLLRLSQLVCDHPRIHELDINPLIVQPRGCGAMVADARIILSED